MSFLTMEKKAYITCRHVRQINENIRNTNIPEEMNITINPIQDGGRGKSPPCTSFSPVTPTNVRFSR